MSVIHHSRSRHAARSIALCAACCAISIGTSSAVAQVPADVTIEETHWGFDGKACRGAFIPLSVLVRNNTASEFEGSLRLTKGLRLARQIGAPIEREVYLAPMTSRWVQFYPFIVDDWEEYRLSWGAGASRDEHYDVPTPSLGERATVLLYDPRALAMSGGVLRRFDQDLFPPLVSALDGLRGLVMDEVPRWQAQRRKAFLDWLHAGGRLYLLHNDEGHFPRFSESLELLNRDEDSYRVGSGWVLRIPQSVRSLDMDFVKTTILTDPRIGNYDRAKWDRYRRSQGYAATAPQLVDSSWEGDTSLLRELQAASRFERNWLVIYGTALAWLLVLFPGCYLVGREARDYRLFYAVFLASAVLFSVGFTFLGRLGGGELSRAHSVAIAHQLSEGIYDVTQWTSAAAKVGGEYTIQHEGTGRLYSTGDELEAVSGRIINGVDGRMEVDIPTASTRTVIHRARVMDAALEVKVLGVLLEGNQLDQLTLGIGPDFPKAPAALFVCYQGEFYEMRQLNDRLVLDAMSHKPGLALLSYNDALQASYLSPWAWRQSLEEDERDAEEVFKGLLRPLLGHSFGLRTTIDPLALMLGPDIVRLLVYAEMPPEFQITGDAFPDQWGYVLYVVDLPVARQGVGSRE